ncbi:urease accessory protein UreE [Alistipes sp.]|uniref:urease accessory protein UreE n=1 Tax=Alistipes sp. TaxID=1872444 RepID=UPI003AF18F93
MKIYTEIIGNLRTPEWRQRAETARVEYLDLDQWTAQKSRFVTRSDRDNEYAVALKRHAQLLDGDVLENDPDRNTIVAIRIRLNDVLVIDLRSLVRHDPETIVRTAVELGHAIGNQHWPAVVKGTKVYVPLTVDRKVMESVMRTHRFEEIDCSFQPGSQIIPYLAPHEIRRLFGGTGPDSDVHHHHPQTHDHPTGQHEHSHENDLSDGHEHPHENDLSDGHEHVHDRDHRHDQERAAEAERAHPSSPERPAQEPRYASNR